MDSTADVDGLKSDEMRRSWILDRERKLGKCLDFKPGNRPRELTVKLEPCATLTGRLVDSAGKSLEGILVCARPCWICGRKRAPTFTFLSPPGARVSSRIRLSPSAASTFFPSRIRETTLLGLSKRARGLPSRGVNGRSTPPRSNQAIRSVSATSWSRFRNQDRAAQALIGRRAARVAFAA